MAVQDDNFDLLSTRCESSSLGAFSDTPPGPVGSTCGHLASYSAMIQKALYMVLYFLFFGPLLVIGYIYAVYLFMYYSSIHPSMSFNTSEANSATAPTIPLGYVSYLRPFRLNSLSTVLL